MCHSSVCCLFDVSQLILMVCSVCRSSVCWSVRCAASQSAVCSVCHSSVCCLFGVPHLSLLVCSVCHCSVCWSVRCVTAQSAVCSVCRSSVCCLFGVSQLSLMVCSVCRSSVCCLFGVSQPSLLSVRCVTAQSAGLLGELQLAISSACAELRISGISATIGGRTASSVISARSGRCQSDLARHRAESAAVGTDSAGDTSQTWPELTTEIGPRLHDRTHLATIHSHIAQIKKIVPSISYQVWLCYIDSLNLHQRRKVRLGQTSQLLCQERR